jgi:carbonic anhydrase
MIPAQEALKQLKAGNRRFVSGQQHGSAMLSEERRINLVAGQEPFAIILGCSDSRVPAELIFDQGLGDLFVIRVAGNVVAPSLIGSVEFAAEKFGTRLVVVLGHTQCGAIQATIEELQRPSDMQSRNLRSIVERVEPSVRPLLLSELAQDPGALELQAVRENIRYSVAQLRHGSDILAQLISDSGLMIVGAEYVLETGEVRFLSTDTAGI